MTQLTATMRCRAPPHLRRPALLDRARARARRRALDAADPARRLPRRAPLRRLPARASDVARNVLTDRLGRLVDEGILERRAYQERPERFEYRLTEKGVDLWPVLVVADEVGRPPLRRRRGPADADPATATAAARSTSASAASAAAPTSTLAAPRLSRDPGRADNGPPPSSEAPQAGRQPHADQARAARTRRRRSPSRSASEASAIGMNTPARRRACPTSGSACRRRRSGCRRARTPRRWPAASARTAARSSRRGRSRPSSEVNAARSTSVEREQHHREQRAGEHGQLDHPPRGARRPRRRRRRRASGRRSPARRSPPRPARAPGRRTAGRRSGGRRARRRRRARAPRSPPRTTRTATPCARRSPRRSAASGRIAAADGRRESAGGRSSTITNAAPMPACATTVAPRRAGHAPVEAVDEQQVRARRSRAFATTTITSGVRRLDTPAQVALARRGRSARTAAPARRSAGRARRARRCARRRP